MILNMMLIAISMPFNLHLETFIVLNGLALILVMVDYYITPVKKVFHIERIGDYKLSLLEEEIISFKVYNKDSAIATIEVLHEIPSTFECNNSILKGKINPHTNEEFELMVKPTKRGTFILKEIYIRRQGKLGLIKKDTVINCVEEYKVYPSLKNLQKYHKMLRKDYLLSSGNNIIKKKAQDGEFESLREYVKGDDIRKIHWIKSAKENKLMVNQYEPENNKHIYILLDTGRSMSYQVNAYTKLDLGINAALFLSDVACYNKDKSGLLVFNRKVDTFIKPSKGDHHRNRILETLYQIEGTKFTSSYEEALFHLSKYEKRRSLICIFTDIDTLQEVDYIQKSLGYIIRKHHVVMFLLKDEKLQEATKINIKNKKDVYIKGIAYKMSDERKKIIRALHAIGVTSIECDGEDIVYKAVNEYMKVKNTNIL